MCLRADDRTPNDLHAADTQRLLRVDVPAEERQGDDYDSHDCRDVGGPEDGTADARLPRQGVAFMRTLTTASAGPNSCFFFSSRRRHTRFDCDWSSDVCSSD